MASRWRQALQQKGPEIFRGKPRSGKSRKAQGYEPGESSDELKKLIGELTAQNDSLKKSERHCLASEPASTKESWRYISQPPMRKTIPWAIANWPRYWPPGRIASGA
jgi:hypothetical protein